MKLAYDFYKSLLLINKNLNKDIFISKTGARNGYSYEMFSRMFESITSELVDLEKEFEKYYSFEYNSIEQFLWKKYNIKGEYIKELMEEKKNNPDCKMFRKDELSYGDDSIAQFTFSDPIYQRIIDILMLK